MVRKPPLSDVDPDLLQWILYGLSLFFFGVAVLGAVGEYLGWWDVVGEVLMSVGTLAGVLIGVFSVLEGATRDQVARVHDAVVDNGSQLETLDEIQLELDRQTGVLAQIRDRL